LSYKSALIRKWVSAALGAALLCTSLVTGLGSANAAAVGDFSGRIVAGATGGSGTIIYSSPLSWTTAFKDSRCRPYSGSTTQPAPSDLRAVVTIGGKVYTSPLVSQWPTQTTTVAAKGCSGQTGWLPDPVGTLTETGPKWSMSYSCLAAGTRVIVADSRGYVYADSVPANGPLPASCTAVSAPVPTITTITGTAKVGSTLAAVPGTWESMPLVLTYQWKANGVAITGATAATYKPAAAQVGKTITVTVTEQRTAGKGGYAITSKTSAATAAVVAGTLGPAPVPAITGPAKVGSTLTAVPGTWGPAPVALTYQWKANGVAITGATAATYKVAAAHRGKTLTVTVTGTKAGYTTKSKTSVATAKIV
jgi:hypothetical protein